MKKFLILLTICLVGVYQASAQGDNPNPPEVTIFGNGQVINCTSDPVRIGVIVSPWVTGFEYEWNVGGNDSSLIVKPTSNTTYQITVSHPGNGFETIKSIKVKVENDPVLASDQIVTVGDKTCPGEEITLSVDHSGGYAPYFYAWSTGATSATTTAEPNEASTYIVTITDACGSTAEAEVSVDFTPHAPLSYPKEQIVEYDCDGDEIVIEPVTGLAEGGVGYGYTFFDVEGNDVSEGIEVKATEGATVHFSLTDACGIQFKDVSVDLKQRPFETPKPETIAACENETVNLVRSDDQYYFWDGQTMHPSYEVNARRNWVYELQYIDRCGTQKQVERSILVDKVESNFDFDVENFERRVRLSAEDYDENATYSWFISDELVGTNPDIEISLGEAEHHEVTLEVENENGCTHQTTREVIIQDGIRVVSAISPNGDGLNDAFRVEIEDELMLFNIKIFNRWGQLIYESYDQYFEWSGENLEGKRSLATFTYLIKATTSTGREIEKRGTLTTVYEN